MNIIQLGTRSKYCIIKKKHCTVDIMFKFKLYAVCVCFLYIKKYILNTEDQVFEIVLENLLLMSRCM